jgi:hypothetical protein
MADPISWGLIIGGGARALGSIMEGNSQAGQYKAEAAFEKQNALNLTAQAQQIGAAGARDEEAARREYRAFAGGQAATISESNLGMEGSALDIVRDSETAANLDALNIRHDAGERAREARYGAAQARSRSSLARQMAGRARLGGYIGAAGQIAGTVGAVKSWNVTKAQKVGG